MSQVKKISKHKEFTIPILLAIGFLVFILSTNMEFIEFFDDFISVNPSETFQLFLEDNFVKFGLSTIFLYEFIPSIFRIIGTSGFYVGLLDSGVSPMMLILLTAIGKLGGQYLLYMLGRFLFRIFKGGNKDLARADHLLHKYRIIIFFVIPYIGTLGNIVMVIAGHERLGFARIAPILFVSNVIRTGTWLFFFIGEMELASIL